MVLKKLAQFVTRPLLDVPNLPGGFVGDIIEQGLEDLSSPLGIASAALIPVTGGASLGLRGAGAQAARLATRGAAETAVGGAAGYTARRVSEELPEDTNPALRLAATLGAGAIGGGVTAAGANRALLAASPAPRGRMPRSGVKTDKAVATDVASFISDVKRKAIPASRLFDKSESAKIGDVVQFGDKYYRLKPSGVYRPSTKYYDQFGRFERIYLGPQPGISNTTRLDPDRIARGRSALLSRIDMEARRGGLDDETATVGADFIRALPDEYVESLGSSFFAGSFESELAGFYNPSNSIINIMKAPSANDPGRTIAHEVTHHIHQFLSPAQAKKLARQWERSVKPEFDRYVASQEKLLKSLKDQGMPQAQISKAMTEAAQKVPYRVRGGYNEWLAEVVTDKAARESLLKRNPDLRQPVNQIKQVVVDMMISLRNAILGYDPDAAERIFRKISDWSK